MKIFFVTVAILFLTAQSAVFAQRIIGGSAASKYLKMLIFALKYLIDVL